MCGVKIWDDEAVSVLGKVTCRRCHWLIKVRQAHQSLVPKLPVL
jgi:hypothetical protein